MDSSVPTDAADAPAALTNCVSISARDNLELYERFMAIRENLSAGAINDGDAVAALLADCVAQMNTTPTASPFEQRADEERVKFEASKKWSRPELKEALYRLKNLERDLPDIAEHDTMFTNKIFLSPKVHVGVDAETGARSVVATRDIAAGDVLIVEHMLAGDKNTTTDMLRSDKKMWEHLYPREAPFPVAKTPWDEWFPHADAKMQSNFWANGTTSDRLGKAGYLLCSFNHGDGPTANAAIAMQSVNAAIQHGRDVQFHYGIAGATKDIKAGEEVLISYRNGASEEHPYVKNGAEGLTVSEAFDMAAKFGMRIVEQNLKRGTDLRGLASALRTVLVANRRRHSTSGEGIEPPPSPSPSAADAASGELATPSVASPPASPSFGGKGGEGVSVGREVVPPPPPPGAAAGGSYMWCSPSGCQAAPTGAYMPVCGTPPGGTAAAQP